jgi:Zn finger protein HypA/HybF involved in hydrogenase expression
MTYAAALAIARRAQLQAMQAVQADLWTVVATERFWCWRCSIHRTRDAKELCPSCKGKETTP